MLRGFFSVIAGYAPTGVLLMLTGLIWVFTKDETMIHANISPIRLAIFSLAFSVIYSIVGAIFCVKISRGINRTNLIVVAILGELFAGALVMTLLRDCPTWYHLGILVEHPVAVFVGARIGAYLLALTTPRNAN